MLSNYLLDKFFNNKKDGIMVEVGAAGPEFLSQSKPFRDIGWRCICIEPNPKFAQMHRDVGNEIYEYACSYEDKDDVNFEMVTQPSNGITYESFSSLGIPDNIVKISGYSGIECLNIEKIKVNVRKLDTILEEAKVSKVDYVIVDVEGWELDVMKGFSIEKYKPKVVVLECIGDNELYHEYMNSINYKYDSSDNTTGPNLIYFNQNY